MSSQQNSHRLAVILHADIAGSTSLVQMDERIAHDRITGTFKDISETIRGYHGTVHEIRGDALVAEFSRASDAVCAAISLQHENAARNSLIADKIIPEIRVGIGLGEVVVADTTVTGAGVILAQRIEQLADRGGICITEAIREALPDRFPFYYESLGEQTVKGFAQTVRVHKVGLEESAQLPRPASPPGKKNRLMILAAPIVLILLSIAIGLSWTRPWQTGSEPASLARLAFELPDKPSIAVLPFKNLSDDGEQAYLADGFTEDIITRLSRIPELFVIAHNSTGRYKDHNVLPKQVAEEQGVRYVLQGSVQRSGDKLRINTQLVDALSGEHVWAEKYDYRFGDLFAAQDDITHNIAVAMQVNLTQGDEARGRSTRATNPEIFELTQKAVWHFRKFSAEDNAIARELTKEALEIAPDDVFALQMEAWLDYQRARFGWSTDREGLLQRAEEIALRTLELSQDDPETYFLLSFLLPLRGDIDGAIEMGRKAVALSPSHANAVAGLATNLAYAGRPAEAVPLLEKAMRLSPHYPVWFDSALGLSHLMLGQYEAAIKALNKVIASGTLLEYTYARLAAVYALKGDLKNAYIHAEQVLELNPDFSVDRHTKALPYKNKVDLERETDALRLAGLR